MGGRSASSGFRAGANTPAAATPAAEPRVASLPEMDREERRAYISEHPDEAEAYREAVRSGEFVPISSTIYELAPDKRSRTMILTGFRATIREYPDGHWEYTTMSPAGFGGIYHSTRYKTRKGAEKGARKNLLTRIGQVGL